MSASEIKSSLQELYSINQEIKSLNERRKFMNERKKLIEEKIQNYLKSQGLPGVKSQTIAVSLDEKESYTKKKVKDSDADSAAVLERYGIRDAEKVLKEVLMARKGDPVLKPKLKIKKLEN